MFDSRHPRPLQANTASRQHRNIKQLKLLYILEGKKMSALILVKKKKTKNTERRGITILIFIRVAAFNKPRHLKLTN